MFPVVIVTDLDSVLEIQQEWETFAKWPFSPAGQRGKAFLGVGTGLVTENGEEWHDRSVFETAFLDTGSWFGDFNRISDLFVQAFIVEGMDRADGYGEQIKDYVLQGLGVVLYGKDFELIQGEEITQVCVWLLDFNF